MRKNYLWYQFFRYGIARPALQLFYSDITVAQAGIIPPDKPVLLVGNHQNAFLDALHIVTNTNKFVHFLSRAEPFEFPVLKHFFRSVNMLPVYRVRDGFSTIKKNEKTFNQCFARLKDGDAILVFAEANHDLKRRVRPLSKGFTRIAFGAEARYNWELDLQVVPFGLNYSRHRKSRTAVHIAFGEPIPVRDFRQTYLNDTPEAARLLTQVTAEKMKELTMHVPKLDHYRLHHLLLDDLEANRHALVMPEVVNRRVSVAENYCDGEMLDKAEQLHDEAGTAGIELNDFVSAEHTGPKDWLLAPLYLFALVNNALPYQLVRWVTTDYIEDHVFDASAKFLLGLLFLPLYYGLVAAVLGFAGATVPVAVGYFLSSLATAPLFVRAKNLIITNSVQKLKEEKPRLYQSIKSKVDYFKDLREKLFGDEPVD